MAARRRRLVGLVLACAVLAAPPASGESGAKPGVESMTLNRDTVRPGESARLSITLKAPAGPNHRMLIHAPAYVEPADFTATPGWTVTVPEGERSVTVTITANANATPAFGGPYVDLHPDYDPAAPTRRLAVIKHY